MPRTMLDEYKTPKHFWAEAVETACHATNRLYLHKLLGKTTYELLTGNKPQVGKHRRSKFSPKSHERFHLVTTQTLTLTVSTTISPERLKRWQM